MRRRRQGRTCEVCTKTYNATYSDQRTCSRTCGITLKGQIPGRKHKLNQVALNEPIARERDWLQRTKRERWNSYMLARYHSDPTNWSTNKKRTRIFDRDGWTCRVCGRKVRDDVKRSHPRKANVGHIIAKSKGGPWEPWNLATLCYDCNRKDGSTHKIPIQTALDVSFGSHAPRFLGRRPA